MQRISFLSGISEVLKKIFFSCPRIIFINFYRLLLRREIFFSKRIPKDRHAILAINYVTCADPVIVLASLKKRIIFLADSRCFETRFTNFFFRKLANSIPVFKKQFAKNIKTFKELFKIFSHSKSKKRNIFLGIFPEGRLNKSTNLDEFFKGTAYLSYKMKLPIIPVYITNIFKGPEEKDWISKHPILDGLITIFCNLFKKIHVFIGEPVNPVAENIFRDLKNFTDKERYKIIINNLNISLKKEFSKLERDARQVISMLSREDSASAETFSAGEEEEEDEAFL